MATAAHAPPWWERDTTPGYLLLAATAASFLLLNSPLAPAFTALLKAPVAFTFPGFEIAYELRYFVKDAMMAVFFLYVGLELKREAMLGPLKNPREAALPAMAALGGMAAPALIYLAIATHGHPEASASFARGWAIPTATDIAFAIGALSLLGARVPAGLRLFILTLAVVDDLGAIMVIALFYTSDLAVGPLILSACVFAALMALNRAGVKALTPYWILGLILWGAMAKSGMSPTLAGVLTAVAIPMHGRDGRKPLLAAEHALKPYVQLGIMPLFALAIAGVPLAGVSLESFSHPVTVAIAMGLLLGKPLGIVTLTLITAQVLKQPPPCRPLALLGASMIAGIGFTMSLFVGVLAFPEADLAAPVRFGVLGGSALSAVLGLAVLAFALQRPEPISSPQLADMERDAEREGVLERH